MRGRGKIAFAFILICLVSLFADMTYEGGRSVVGPYLGFLGASSVLIGALSIGDMLNYSFRGVSGILGSKFYSKRFLASLTVIGYSINLIAVPMLAFSGNWPLAFLLVLLERIGKGLRTPPRDVFLTEVTREIGRGKGFGIHEVMDQIGAFVGPIMVSYSLIYSGSYSFSYKLLGFPAIISLILLSFTIYFVPKIRKGSRDPGSFRMPYLIFLSVFLFGMGFPHWIFFSYLTKSWGIFDPHVIALLFSIAMLTDAIVAIPAGIIAEKEGLGSLFLAPAFSFLFLPFVLSPGPFTAISYTIFWGLTMGAFEVSARVIVAENFRGRYKSLGYGILGLSFGGGWSIGNVLMGAMSSYSLGLLLLTLTTELGAIIVLIVTIKRGKVCFTSGRS